MKLRLFGLVHRDKAIRSPFRTYEPSLSKDKAAPSEARDTFGVEQVLYFSIPGALFVILTLASAVVLNIKITLDAALFAAVLLASVPIGFPVTKHTIPTDSGLEGN